MSYRCGIGDGIRTIGMEPSEPHAGQGAEVMRVYDLHFLTILTAIVNGCEPEWSAGYDAWVCGCPDGLHYGDQQCSIISVESAQRRRATHAPESK